MRKVKDDLINICDVKIVENSRIRTQSDVSDLMNDIGQHGILEPIGIRIEDNSLIFGNRRVMACKKLNYKTIPCIYFEGVSDEDLLILNLVENINRKNIGSFEIGRICNILEEKGLSRAEISKRLGKNISRVSSCICAYNVTKGTPFENLIKFGWTGKSRQGVIPEGLIWKIQTSLARAFKGRLISKENWDILLPAIEEGLITTKNIYSLRMILTQDKSLSLKQALDKLQNCKILNMFIPLNIKELDKAMSEEKVGSDIELVRKIIRDYNKKLFF